MLATISPNAAPATAQRTPASYLGPDRRAGGRDPAAWLTGVLDEIDYGMLLVTADAQVTFINHTARLELDGQHPLQLFGQGLRAHRPQDVAPLFDALAAAQRGLRKLVALGEGEHRVSISVVPLLPARPERGGRATEQLTLLMLGKRQVCERLSVQGYARSMGLTPAETRVLECLCSGMRAREIAKSAGVAVSTVRTQIGSIRAKTSAASICDLVSQVAVLPPLVTVLRAGLAMAAR